MRGKILWSVALSVLTLTTVLLAIFLINHQSGEEYEKLEEMLSEYSPLVRQCSASACTLHFHENTYCLEATRKSAELHSAMSKIDELPPSIGARYRVLDRQRLETQIASLERHAGFSVYSPTICLTEVEYLRGSLGKIPGEIE